MAFHNLTIKDIKQETEDTVSIAFNIPSDAQADFNYTSGQYVTIKADIQGEDVRRSYSLCSATADEHRVAVKAIASGKMSGYLNNDVKVGDTLSVMNPQGNFVYKASASHIVGIAAGSGITPIISIIKTALSSGKTATLIYGNKSANQTIFKAELDALKAANESTFNLIYVYSREESGNALTNGRLDGEKINQILSANGIQGSDFYLCGPEAMITSGSEALAANHAKENIHFELFTTPVTEAAPAAAPAAGDFSGNAEVQVIMDGDEYDFTLPADGASILDAAMDAGADAPFSCKGAVCCTCKAQVIEGSASMEMNYALSDEEVEEGFILTCQAHPTSAKLVVDYDVI